VTRARLALSRDQILAFRRRVGALDERLAPGADSLRITAWAGLQDSMPRAALLSIHARVAETGPDALDHPSLAQVWGPRFSLFVVSEPDVPIFTLARYPRDGKGRRVADEAAARLRKALGERRITYGQAGAELGVPPNSLRYATTTGMVRLRWEGARAPRIWVVPPPDMTPDEALLELARRYLHVYGPTTAAAFSKWAGIGLADGPRAFDGLGAEIVPVGTPVGDASILGQDEGDFGARTGDPAPARLLPSGDSFWLCHGRDRDLLVPDPKLRDELWTSRVWPGALLVNGEVAGTWRRANQNLSIQAWRGFTPAERDSVEAEATSLPLPGLPGPIRVRWEA
jgi:Winged helix DNA-binding domain